MFSIIIVGAGLISLTGVTQIVTFSEAEEVGNAEQGMQSAAATLDAINQRSDLNRTMSLAFGSGNIWMNETTLNVTTDGWTEYEDLTVNSLEHRFDRSPEDVTVRYEAGGVFRSDGAFPAFEPSFTCRASGGTTTAIVSVVNLTLDDSREGINVAAGYAQEFRFNEFGVKEESPVASVDNVLNFRARLVRSDRNVTDRSVTVVVNATETSGPDQWDSYFRRLADRDNSGWTQLSTVEYECEADRMLVRITTIELDIIESDYSG